MAVAIPIIIILVLAVVTTIVARGEPSHAPPTGVLVTRDAATRDRGDDRRSCRGAVDVDRARDHRTRARRRHPRHRTRTSREAPRRRRHRLGAGRRRRARRLPPPVPQPGPRRPWSALARRASAPRASASCGRRGLVGLRRQDRRRQDQRHHRLHHVARRALLHSRSPRVRTAVPGRGPAARPRRSTARSPTRAWKPGSSRSTSGACTSAVACRGARPRSGSSARATAPSTTASARRRRARRPVGSTGSRSLVSGGEP